MIRLEPREVGLVAAACALVADQGSKLFMLYGAGFAQLAPGQSIPVLPFFNLVMVALAAIAVLGWLLWRTTSQSLAIGYGLVIGGAIGNNLVDRVIYGRVADFFHFYGFGYDWYVFNIADLAITLGAIAIIYDVLKPEATPDAGHEV